MGALVNQAVYLYLRARTLALVSFLRLTGKRIRVGRGTIFSRTAKISVGSGTLILGDQCYIGPGTVVRANGGKIVLGNHVSIGEYCMLHGQGKIFMDDNVLVATHVSFVPARHTFHRRDIPIRHQPVKSGGIWIGEGAWIASGVRIVDNIRIGKGCILGAGAIVTKDTDAWGIYGGNPAKKIKDRD